MMTKRFGRKVFVCLLCLAGIKAETLIGDVRVDRTSFAPTNKDSVTLQYRVVKPCSITIKVWDADRELVRTLVTKAAKGVGIQKQAWDGRDSAGRVVPNEAYHFTVEAQAADGETDFYDPEATTGGEFGDITKGTVSRASGTLTYQLSQPSRVLARAGIGGSCLLKTLVDWEPRTAGTVTEYWNGKDEDNVIDVLSLKHTIIVSYMTLPDASVIAFGNDKQTYQEYKSAAKAPTERKPERPLTNARMVSPHFAKSRVKDRSFKVKLHFPELDKVGEKAGPAAIPAVRDRLLVRLDVDPKDQLVLDGQQFEIILFVDTVFQAEEERGYLPFNYPIELKQVAVGEHVITANVITFGDQIGVGSRKVKVVR